MVSVVLVNYNGWMDTIECINSISKSVNHDYRIIVVDNCSTDDSFEKLRNNQTENNFILIQAGVNNGFSAGNNIGIRKAIKLGTDYIWLLNNDTLIESDTIDCLIKGFDFSRNCGVTIGKILYERSRDTIWYAGGTISKFTGRVEHWKYNEKNTDDQEKKTVVSFATGCCIFMSIDMLNEVGLLDENYFLYEEDTDYSIRIIEKGFDIVYCPEAIIYHKVSASTGRNSPIMQYYSVRNKYEIIRKHYKGFPKFSAYLYNTLQMLFRCIKRELDFKYYIMGLFAFYNKETGKRNNSF